MVRRIKNDTLIAILIFLVTMLVAYSRFRVTRHTRELIIIFTVMNTFLVYMLTREKFHTKILALISSIAISLVFLVLLFPIYLGLVTGQGHFILKYISPLNHLFYPLAIVLLNSAINTCIEGALLCLFFRNFIARYFYILFIANFLFNLWFYTRP